MGKVVPVLLILVGLVHLLPVTGVLGPDRLASLYGISFHEPNLLILMRNRAILFGLVGLFLIAAAFRPVLQAAALIAGLVSTASFIWLCWSVGGYNQEIARVMWIDVVALVCLLVAAGLFWTDRRDVHLR